MLNYPEIISPRLEIFKDIEFSSKGLNDLKSELLTQTKDFTNIENKNLNLNKKYSALINDINQKLIIFTSKHV